MKLKRTFGNAIVLFALVFLLRALCDPACGQKPAEIRLGAKADDARLGPLTNLRESYFPFTPPTSRDEWATRSQEVRAQILVAAGLWPQPVRPAPRAVVHGRIERDEYTVEKVYLESYPGHFVTGNLYRPKGPAPAGGKRPAVLSPYGHWPGGRFGDLGVEGVEKQIAAGAEEFAVGGRSPLQARCVQLARMGCLVFIYDLEGYADSQQIPEAISHRLAAVRPELNGTRDWGFFSAQAELRLQSIFGLQAYNSLCALDWLASLPEVDSQRIGVTGGSGGATQTMMLCGTDPRPAAAFEAVMVSTAMQGGCPCENACGLRIGTGNVEIAGLMAPKPLGIASANDWTARFHELGWPEMQQLYRLLGAPDRVKLAKLTQFPHNYNAVTRAAMYEWFREHLELGDVSAEERDYVPLTVEEMTVWDAAHPAPAGGVEHEVALVRDWTAANEKQLAAWTPTDAASLEKFRAMMRVAVRAIIGPAPDAADCRFEEGKRETDAAGRTWELRILRDRRRGAALPTLTVRPTSADGRVVVWTAPSGKKSLFAGQAEVRPEVNRLLTSGVTVVAVDLLEQGECISGDQPAAANRTVGGDRDLAAFTYGYNRPLAAQRAADLVSLARALHAERPDAPAPILVAEKGAAAYAVAALALAPDAFSQAVIETAGFRFAGLTDWRDADFLPGAVKYGDLPGLLALAAPTPVTLIGDKVEEFSLTRSAYHAASADANLQLLPPGVAFDAALKPRLAP